MPRLGALKQGLESEGDAQERQCYSADDSRQNGLRVIVAEDECDAGQDTTATRLRTSAETPRAPRAYRGATGGSRTLSSAFAARLQPLSTRRD